jgi:hypothetical protein
MHISMRNVFDVDVVGFLGARVLSGTPGMVVSSTWSGAW